MWKTVLFDLDGTLTDSAEGIVNCVQYALEQLGRAVPDKEQLKVFVGPPLHGQFMEFAGLDSEAADRAVSAYRERYTKTGMFENRLYPWILKLLELFRKNGITMGVASSKPEPYVKQILEYFGIDDYFRVIVGSELDGSRVEKKDVVEEAIRRLHMEHEKKQIVLVGDRKYDVEGARQAGIDCIGVLYGYGSRQELEKEEPVYLAENVSDVAECVISQQNRVRQETIPYKVWRMLYPLGLHYVIMMVVSSLWSLIYIAVEMTRNGNTDADSIMRRIMEQNNLIMIVVSLIAIPVMLWLYRKDEWKRRDEGIRGRIMMREHFGIVRMVMTAVIFITLSALLTQLINWLPLAEAFPKYTDAVAVFAFDKDGPAAAIISLGILVPIAEELVIRGLVYRRMRDYLGIPWAIALSSLLFGLYHGNMLQFIYVTLGSILLCFLYERYRTLWAPILAHMAANTVSTIHALGDGLVLPESSGGFLLLAAAEVVVIAALGVLIFGRGRKHSQQETKETEL